MNKTFESQRLHPQAKYSKGQVVSEVIESQNYVEDKRQKQKGSSHALAEERG
jgi:hypothetical protein